MSEPDSWKRLRRKPRLTEDELINLEKKLEKTLINISEGYSEDEMAHLFSYISDGFWDTYKSFEEVEDEDGFGYHYRPRKM